MRPGSTGHLPLAPPEHAPALPLCAGHGRRAFPSRRRGTRDQRLGGRRRIHHPQPRVDPPDSIDRLDTPTHGHGAGSGVGAVRHGRIAESWDCPAAAALSADAEKRGSGFQQRGLQLTRSGLRVRGGGDRPHHDHPFGARRQGLGKGLGVDTADGEPRPGRRRFRGRAHQIQSGGRTPRFGRGRPHRARAEIVEVLLTRGQPGLLPIMGGPPEHHLGAEDLAGVPGRQILLTQVQHIGARRQRDIGTIVDRE